MNEQQPTVSRFLEAGDVVAFGNTKLEVLFTPGHSPASISFYCREEGFVVAGDVLFYESIGRTDLPGGNFDTLDEEKDRLPRPIAFMLLSKCHPYFKTFGVEVNRPILYNYSNKR